MRKPRLLIVDDEALVCRSLARAFQRGLEVVTVQSAFDARQTLAADPNIEVVLTDFNMPQQNGLELLAWVAKTYPNTRRVLMTGYEPPELQHLLANGVVNAQLGKPFDLDYAAQVLGLHTLRLGSLGELTGAIEASAQSLPLVQVVIQGAPTANEIQRLQVWQQHLLEAGAPHAVVLTFTQTARLPLALVVKIYRAFNPGRPQRTMCRAGLAFVSASRLRRLAVAAANVLPHAWPLRTFAEQGEAEAWLPQLFKGHPAR